ncbi:hypothetical protein Btru_029105 [Bulinus truncatus]|nr:hypothetical protein Btru_029105 [Bulinus truncatus]
MDDYKGRLQQASYKGRLQLTGYKGRLQLTGYKGRLQQAGYKGRLQLTGYKGRLQQAGYKGRLQLTGYKGRLQQAGYKGRLQLTVPPLYLSTLPVDGSKRAMGGTTGGYTMHASISVRRQREFPMRRTAPLMSAARHDAVIHRVLLDRQDVRLLTSYTFTEKIKS